EEIVSSTQPITIDEAQKFPEILSYIKKVVDKKRRPGQCLLSGSSNFLLLKNIAESLAGRAIYLTLYPFSYRE
ncbi:MAG TPA: AAA family ATPase, partial [Elusimicrobia bacterium]|nr:AAA family ATPase [Elusimicrobiota bacterium]